MPDNVKKISTCNTCHTFQNIFKTGNQVIRSR